MLVLYETAAGYALFKLLDDNQLDDVDAIWDNFKTPAKANENLQLVAFKSFKTTADALENIKEISENKIHKDLLKFLKSKATQNEKLAVGEPKLGTAIKDALSIKCVQNSSVNELMRVIRSHLDSLLGDHKAELDAMNLALAHSLGRYKVKFNPEKIDTMIVQAVSLLDDLDKELNNYAMRLREWYGWHFPEIGKIIPDHAAFAKTVKAIGMKENAANVDLSEILPEELIEKVKEEAEISMGTELSQLDVVLISQLCDQVIEMYEYRSQLSEYLKNRMNALAPNLTVLLGELIGARLVARAGSLVNLAKYPASTVQVLGAEKALFRAIKTKRDTPKYGIIYHAQLIAQAGTKLKGKMARKLATKISLSTRVDALSDESVGNSVGLEARAYLERQLKHEEQPSNKRVGQKNIKKDANYKFKSEVMEYDQSADTTIKTAKRKKFDDEEDTPAKKVKTEPTGSSKKKVKQEASDEEEEEAQPVKKEKTEDKKKKKVVVKQESSEDSD
uniref:Nop domain-containing protein n=2 Tax=Panagrolaimus sp. JU765 TaxID=591449 RepID=A0AC34QM52_9BILA